MARVVFIKFAHQIVFVRFSACAVPHVSGFSAMYLIILSVFALAGRPVRVYTRSPARTEIDLCLCVFICSYVHMHICL